MITSPVKQTSASVAAIASILFAASVVPVLAQSPVSVEINAAKVIHTVPREYHGTNFVALWNSTGASPGTVAAFAQLGAGLLRFPGGVPAEWYDLGNPLASGLSEITPQDAWRMAKAGNAEMVFQTNAFNHELKKNKKTGAPYQWDNSGKHAAEFVLQAKREGMKVAFWEVGNEPEMDADKAIKNNQGKVFEAYDAIFEDQARAIKQADPLAKIMGPASTNTYFWWAQKNLEKFLKAHGNRQGTGLVDAVSIHWYPEGGNGAWEKTRSLAQGWAKCMDYIQAQMTEYDSRPLPLYITEWNWGAGDKGDGSEKFANALGCADCVGMFLRTGVSGHTHFCLQHVQRNWGVITTRGDYKPENSVSPTFFGLAMASHLGDRVLETKNSADESNVLSAYATSDDAGNVSVMLINKDSQPQDVQLAFQGFHPASAKIWTLVPANGSVQDRDVIYNGKPSPAPATEKLPDPEQVQVKGPFVQKTAPYSLTVITFTTQPSASLSTPSKNL